MSINARPYVGVTGITDDRQLVDTIVTAGVAGIGAGYKRDLMVGFLTSEQAILGGEPRNKRHVKDMQTLVTLAEKASGLALPVVHYEMDGKTDCAKPLTTVFRDLYREGIRPAAQLNGTPSVDDVARLRDACPDIELIYQLRPELLQKGINAVVDEIGRHRGAFQHVLIDPSCGRGEDMRPGEAASFAIALQRAFPHVIPGFAGGFSGTNAYIRVVVLSAATGSKQFSIDAEGKLRNGADELHALFVQGYLYQTAAGFESPYSS